MSTVNISVVVAAYNIEKYIERCLDSIINQTFRNIEIIVVNDGSTDKTLEKIKPYAKDSRVKSIDKENQGVMSARQSGLDSAIGEYILFVDGDDWLELNALEILYEKAKMTKSDIILYNAYRVSRSGKVIMNTFMDNFKTDILSSFLLGEVEGSICLKFIKLTFIKQNNQNFPLTLHFAEDLAWTSNLFLATPKVNVEMSALYNYYVREGSVTNSITSRVLQIKDSFDFIELQLKKNNKYLIYKEEFEYLYYFHLFEIRFLKYVLKDKEYSPILYDQYRSKKINVLTNKYIKERIKTYPISLKIRVVLYHTSYKLGKLYDKLRIKFNRN